jgi:hypothetical protein
VALVLGSTGLLLRPAGLGDVFNGLATWWQQVITPGDYVTGRLLMGLAVYEPLIYLTALVGFVRLLMPRTINQVFSKNLVYGALRNEAVALVRIAMGLALLLIMQGRQPSNLIPLIVGLAGLASYGANAISNNISAYAQLKREGSLMLISLVLCLFGGLAMRQYASSGETSWLLLLVVAVVFTLALVAFGNVLGELSIGLRAVACALALVLGLHTLATAVQLTHTRPTNPAEAYAIAPAPEELRTLAETVVNASTRAYGEPNVIALNLAESAPPSLRWALRHQTQLSIKAGNADSASALMPESQRPQGEAAFVGSAFAVQRSANLSAARCNTLSDRLDCTSLARWLVFREAGTPKTDVWVLWLRNDVAALASGVR